METSNEELDLMGEGSICRQFFLSVINTQKDLIVLMHNHIPIIFNKAFLDFANVDSAKGFLREFGSLQNRFIPHDSYFHAGKVQNIDEWSTSLIELPENDRIVSMLNYRIEPYAFSVMVATPADEYTILTFSDISQDLIKRIMIENDTSIDKESGAYEKNYFIHTLKSFRDAAIFNQKFVAITIIKLIDSDSDVKKNLNDFASQIKSNVRQSDMLVRWGEKSFLLAYLIDTPENVHHIAQKLRQKLLYTIRLGTAVQKDKEQIQQLIMDAEKILKESSGI